MDHTRCMQTQKDTQKCLQPWAVVCGAIMNVARKLGLNTVSLTETEVVSSGKRMPKCTWFQYFRLAQGDKPIKIY